jgi:hypothetical protein
MAIRMTADDQRKLLESSFEPHGSGFLFYRNRWSKGIPVSAAERDAYLAIPVFGSRANFYAQIKGRAPVGGPRGYHYVARQMANALPKGMATSVLLLSSALMIFGIFANPDLERWIAFSGGLAGVLFSAWIIFYRRKM